jgi:hypothetical protein
MNVTAVSSGVLSVGDPVSGSGVTSNSVIASQISGTVGGIGVYRLNLAATAYAASTTITGVNGVSTSWVSATAAAVGELTAITK